MYKAIEVYFPYGWRPQIFNAEEKCWMTILFSPRFPTYEEAIAFAREQHESDSIDM
jgi:hypothetical protein